MSFSSTIGMRARWFEMCKHRCGIMVEDIKEDAYIEGVLIDFSHSKTIRHLAFDPKLGFDPYTVGQECAWADLGNMETMFYYWNKAEENTPKIRVRAIPDFSRLSRLRNKKFDEASLENYKFFDPTEFDWRKFGQQRADQGRTSELKKPAGVKKKRASRTRRSPQTEKSTQGSTRKPVRKPASRRET